MRSFAALLLTATVLAGTPASASKPDAPTAKSFLPGKRLVLQGASWAGWFFDGAEKAERYDEMDNHPPFEPSLKLRVVWLSDQRFLLVEDRPAGEAKPCPPRIWMYEAVKLTPRQVTLQGTWLGWGAPKSRGEPEVYRVMKPGT